MRTMDRNMADDTPPSRTTGSDDRRPMMKIGDATYGRPPSGRVERQVLRIQRWFFLSANRWLVTALLLVCVFTTIVLAGAYGPIPVEVFLDAGISPGAALIELLKTIVTVLVIVLSINQLVLSPGLGPVGDQQERFDDEMDLRRRTESLTGVAVSPSSPGRFLQTVTSEMVDTTDDLRDAAEGIGDANRREELVTYADAVEYEAAYVSNGLETDRFGLFEVTPTVLRFATSEKFKTLHGIEHTGDEVPAAPLEQMDDLLELFTVAREYMKTVYIRSEFIDLSQGLLYVGLPSLVLTYIAAQMYSPDVFPGATLGIRNLLLFLAGAVTVSIAPVVLLVSYVLRLAAMSRSTLFLGPFAAGTDD